MQPHKRNPRNRPTIEDLQNNDQSGRFEHDFLDDAMIENNSQDLVHSYQVREVHDIEDNNTNRRNHMNRPGGKRGQNPSDSNKPGRGTARQNKAGQHSGTNQATGTKS